MLTNHTGFDFAGIVNVGGSLPFGGASQRVANQTTDFGIELAVFHTLSAV